MNEQENWQKQKQIGEQKQQVVARCIEQCNSDYTTIISQGLDKAKDITVVDSFLDLNEQFKVEVKFCSNRDKNNKPYNNIVLECECNNKPSGISTTQSKFWCQVMEGYIFFFHTDELRQYVKDNNLLIRNYQNSDGARASGYLISWSKAKDKLKYKAIYKENGTHYKYDKFI